MTRPIKVAYLILISWGFIIGALILIGKINNLTFVEELNFTKTFSFNYLEGKNNLDQKLATIVKESIGDTKGDFTFYIENLNNPKQVYFLNQDQIIPAASLYKLFLLSAAYEAIEKGEISLDSEITSSTGHLKDVLGSEDFGYQDLIDDEITYPVSEILQRIATISDNYASIMLAEKLGWDKVQLQADKLGMKHTKIEDPISTSSSDIGLYFKKLSKGQVVSAEASQKIIDLLASSKLNDRIPKNLPEGLKIAHKTAELSRLRHDAGIIFLDGNPYILVMMSQNLEYEDDGVEVLADISGKVYQYFQSQPKTEAAK